MKKKIYGINRLFFRKNKNKYITYGINHALRAMTRDDKRAAVAELLYILSNQKDKELYEDVKQYLINNGYKRLMDIFEL